MEHAEPGATVRELRALRHPMQGFNTAQVQMITGQIATPEDGAAFTQDVADKWRQANRLLLEQYKLWGAQKAEAGG
jgi:hypothetical protein